MSELKRWRHRIDHGDVIQSPRGEYVLYEDARAEIERLTLERSAFAHDAAMYAARLGIKDETRMMTQFRMHRAEGKGWQCTRCGFHRNNRLIHTLRT